MLVAELTGLWPVFIPLKVRSRFSLFFHLTIRGFAAS